MGIASLVVLALVMLVAWFGWLFFCAHVARRNPEHAADIAKAAGVSFPFQRRRHRKCDCH